MVFKWTEQLAVGVDIIDNQHKELFDRVNKLIDAFNEEIDEGIVRELLDFLGTYVDEHFSFEQDLMKHYNYNDIDIHVFSHKLFTENMAKIKKEILTNGVNYVLTQHLQDHLCDWLINHIYKEDRKLGTFLRLNGKQ
ncbi:MAG: bacteriohemerythrin [Candidatus Magnetoovum sp. WYHC-5]|nr:bacteriohemerythrin [Candidatus Magnetoovum sp. WYHC-5]